MAKSSGKDAVAAQAIQSLYKDPIKVSDLQDLLRNSHSEVIGPTPPKDQKIFEMMFNYLQVNKQHATPEVIDNFKVGGSWICCGKVLSRLLADVPKASIQGIIDAAKQKGFAVEVSD